MLACDVRTCDTCGRPCEEGYQERARDAEGGYWETEVLCTECVEAEYIFVPEP